MNLAPDFRDLLAEFERVGVSAILVGGYAVAFHGRPRATKDINLLLEDSDGNLARAASALEAFGAPPHVVEATRALQPEEIVYLGQPPLRVDLLRTIDGVSSDRALENAVLTRLDGVEVRIISLDDLIANKRAAGRPQDLVDADFLERIRARTTP